MKTFIEGIHMTNEDLTVADQAYSWNDSFSRTTVHCGM